MPGKERDGKRWMTPMLVCSSTAIESRDTLLIVVSSSSGFEGVSQRVSKMPYRNRERETSQLDVSK